MNTANWLKEQKERETMAVYKDKNGTWYFKGRYQGKFNTRRGFKTRKEAQRAEDLLKDSILTVKYLDEVSEEYITYLSTHENGSAYSVDRIYNKHIKSDFGYKRIDKITVKDIRSLQNQMLTKRKANGEKYANRTINQTTGTLVSIMNYAVRFDYIEKNPCSNFKPLKEIKTHDTLLFWTDEEFKQAIQYENDFEWYCYFVLSYLTGMRKGEVRALKWIDIDFDNGVIKINRHMNDKIRKEEKEKQIEPTTRGRKNGDAHIVAMDCNLICLLKELKVHEMEYDGWNENTYLFGIFKPVGQYTPNRHLNHMADCAGLTRISVHGLRHSHVSYLISKGLNAYEIAERIGDSVEMVTTVYGHMFPNPQKNIVEVLNNNFDFMASNKQTVVGQNVGQITGRHKKLDNRNQV